MTADEPGSGEPSCASHTECAFGYCVNGSVDGGVDGICTGGTTCTAAGGPPIEGLPFRRCE